MNQYSDILDILLQSTHTLYKLLYINTVQLNEGEETTFQEKDLIYNLFGTETRTSCKNICVKRIRKAKNKAKIFVQHFEVLDLSPEYCLCVCLSNVC